jgi:hypothetical protein
VGQKAGDGEKLDVVKDGTEVKQRSVREKGWATLSAVDAVSGGGTAPVGDAADGEEERGEGGGEERGNGRREVRRVTPEARSLYPTLMKSQDTKNGITP